MNDVAIVVPTLGTRTELLIQSLKSVREAGCEWTVVVAPLSVNLSRLIDLGLIDQVVADPMAGLADAINEGLNSLDSRFLYANWLGDDDLLTPGCITRLRQLLEEDPHTTLVYGACDYIRADGSLLFHSSSGRWARPLLRFGPQMIPQPGSLFRLEAFRTVGGLNPKYKWAFDLDLFLRLDRVGNLKYVPITTSCFRWHPESLSVGGRIGSVNEASHIRIQNLPRLVRPFASLWEPLLRKAIMYAGSRVSRVAMAN